MVDIHFCEGEMHYDPDCPRLRDREAEYVYVPLVAYSGTEGKRVVIGTAMVNTRDGIISMTVANEHKHLLRAKNLLGDFSLNP